MTATEFTFKPFPKLPADNSTEPVNFIPYVKHWNHLGPNVIVANTADKTIDKKWGDFRGGKIPESGTDKWEATDAYKNGIAIIAGLPYHRPDLLNAGYKLVVFDIDKRAGFKAVFTRNGKEWTIEELAEVTLVQRAFG